jgi:hypothetical protein
MSKTAEEADALDWLMEGDPAIRWQTMRDLLDESEVRWQRERARVAEDGWGRRLLAKRGEDGRWGGGLYTPKWTSTNYTLLVLRDMGLPQDHPAGREGAQLLLGRMTGEAFQKRLEKLDLCIVGMYLSLSSYFGVADPRVDMLAEEALSSQLPDGGWNCAARRHPVHHSSLHTTMNVLDGMADFAEYRGREAAQKVAEAMRRAHEFILAHRLFRSDKTGRVIREAFTRFSFPPRWRWDALRGLDHLRRMNIPRDERLQDAIDLVRSKRRRDGRWNLENHHRGQEFFRLERPGKPSRWNTLRALRVLRANGS